MINFTYIKIRDEKIIYNWTAFLFKNDKEVQVEMRVI